MHFCNFVLLHNVTVTRTHACTHDRGSDMTLLQSVQIRLPSTGPTNIEGSIPVAVVAIMMVVGVGRG